MLHTIRKVEYVEGYKLKLTFNDKKKKIVDLQDLSKAKRPSVFYPFRDIEFFKSVKLDKSYGTVVWLMVLIFALILFIWKTKTFKHSGCQATLNAYFSLCAVYVS